MIKKIRYFKWYKAIKESGLFDMKFYLFRYSDVRKSGIDPIKHYLKFGAEEGRNPSGDFDTLFYLQMYKDVEESGVNPLAHYILYGKDEGRSPSPAGINKLEIKNQIDSNIQKKSNNNLVNLKKRGEIALKHTRKGDIKYDKNRPTIVVSSHESSATGAPLLGLNIAKALSLKYNIINLVMKRSNIHSEFEKDAFLLIEGLSHNSHELIKEILLRLNNKYDIECVLCNSVVTYPVVSASYELQLPILSLVHEFAEYTQAEKMFNTILYSNRVVLPANIIKNSILEQAKEEYGLCRIPNNIEILPQGKLPYLSDSYGKNDTIEELFAKLNISKDEKKDVKIVVASGYAQIRKGLDLFIYTANYIKKNYKGRCKFVWVGDGFLPKVDFAYSLWLDREIKHLGLSEDFLFLGHQKNLENIFSIADMFCLTSRMDPFPNVVIDALGSDLPIACFRDASGSVEFLEKNGAECVVADYMDTYHLGSLIGKYFSNSNNKIGVNSKIAKDKLDFKNYMDKIFGYIEDIKKENIEDIKILEYLNRNKHFDNDFYGFSSDRKASIVNYINRRKKNIYKGFNPKIGFNDLLWLESHPQSRVPLYDALNEKVESTHDVIIEPSLSKGIKVDFRYAVHLHLYYIDLLDEFVRYFKNLSGNFDIFVTVIADEHSDKIIKAFKKNTKASSVEVITVKNIGRDMAPMMFNLKEKIFKNRYEVIGHFHSKKSSSTDANMGDRWRKYLLDNLIGDKNIARDVLAAFNDDKIGLVFAEDRHSSDIGENKIYMDNLASMLDIKTKIDETPIFPLGNMFWARTDAIKEIFDLDAKAILQKEPLPYDGSYMHAIERIIPYVVQKNGYSYMTVYKKGTMW